jgi:class 3 adenylate cyclase
MAPRAERKLAAILAADVVGYSRLVGDDEAGTVARLRALRKELIEPLIAEHRGRMVKLMGDGALVEFASAVDAVECAVAVQKGVAERVAAAPEDRPPVPHRGQHRRPHRRGRRHPGRRGEHRRAPRGTSSSPKAAPIMPSGILAMLTQWPASATKLWKF